MTKLDIEKILRKLLSDRVFVSEADFQFSLAWKIKEEYSGSIVKLEECLWKIKDEPHVDIIVKFGNSMIPIELKYPTKKQIIGEVKLKEHAAYDHRCYDIVKDIQRIEKIMKSEYKCKEGYVIILTNNHSYTKMPVSNKKALYDNFRIYEGKELSGKLSWIGNPSKGTIKGRENSIRLSGKYKVHWNEYLINGVNFWCAIIKISN